MIQMQCLSFVYLLFLFYEVVHRLLYNFHSKLSTRFMDFPYAQMEIGNQKTTCIDFYDL